MTTDNNTNATTAASKAPQYFAYQIREGRDSKSFFTKIGAAWANKDGKGFTLQLNAVPLDGRVTLRLATETKE